MQSMFQLLPTKTPSVVKKVLDTLQKDRILETGVSFCSILPNTCLFLCLNIVRQVSDIGHLYIATFIINIDLCF